MDHLNEVSVEDLQQALDNVEDKKTIQRLLAAIAYKNGVTQTELAEWYGVERRTIYSWLKRLDTDESIERALQDDRRAGRPRKLSEEEQQQFEQTLHEPPSEIGYDAPAWTPALVRMYLQDAYDVEYSTPSCRRLMKEAGLWYQKPPQIAGEVDPDENGEYCDELTKRDGIWIPR